MLMFDKQTNRHRGKFGLLFVFCFIIRIGNTRGIREIVVGCTHSYLCRYILFFGKEIGKMIFFFITSKVFNQK